MAHNPIQYKSGII